MKHSELFLKRQAALAKPRGPILADQTEVQKLLDQEPTITESLRVDEKVEVVVKSADEILIELGNKFNENRFNILFENARSDVIASIIPLGLGSKVAQTEKKGGNVDTVHNVRQDTYATEKERQAYKSRRAYKDKEYEYHHGNADFNRIQRENSELAKSGQLVDEATGNRFQPNPKGKTDKNLDHVISAHEIHNDAGRVLAGKDGATLANQDSNLQYINSSVNKTKNTYTTEDYLNNRPARIAQKQKRIDQLKAKPTLSTQEQNELRNAENYVAKHSAVDECRMRESDRKARDAYEKEVNEYYRSGKFIKRSGTEVAKSGLKYGVSAALGLLLSNFFNNVFDEIMDWYEHGRSEESLWKELKVRLGRVVRKVTDDWKQVAEAFAVGCVGGFLSEIVSILMNMLMTTSRRLKTVIMQGGGSLLRAVKYVLFRPENMTRQEGMHEASKIFCTGMILTGGIILEEVVDNLIRASVPFLAPISGMLSTILIGSLTAVASCLVCYLFDRADFFNAVKGERLTYINNELDVSLQEAIAEAKQL